MVKKQKMASPILAIGMILLFLGIIFILISSFTGPGGKGGGKIDVAAGGFIGPIPFGFFSSPGMFWIWLVIMLALLLIWFIFFRLRGS